MIINKYIGKKEKKKKKGKCCLCFYIGFSSHSGSYSRSYSGLRFPAFPDAPRKRPLSLCIVGGRLRKVRLYFVLRKQLMSVNLITKIMSNTNPDNQQGNQALIDAENYIKKGCEIIQREATRVRHEQQSIDAMSKKLDQVHFSSTVKLNVGGQHFTTSVQTLKKDPNSMLAAMFSGKFEMKPSEDGSFFIDRDGTYFRFILNYLRNGELILPEGATFLKELEAEAKFYQLQGILDELKPKEPKVFEETVILTNEEHRRVMKSWLPEAMKGEWRLLFRASRDGFAASAFHSKCDNKGPTITVVKSRGNIFGGFTEKAWTSKYNILDM